MILKFVPIWTALILVLELFESSDSTCSSHDFHVNDGVKDRALDNRVFMTLTIQQYPSECFSECVHDCRCLSFNVCGKQCQLSTGTKDMSPDNLKVKQGCSYYDLRGSMTAGLPVCCSVSNPCLNGGSCTSAPPNSKKRWQCTCNVGFYGEICQTKNPRSCADFLTADQTEPTPLSGQYEILDANGKPYSVYCDFDSESGFAWTLLLSFSRHNGPTVAGKGLLEDSPYSENNPNWKEYRLSLSRMNNLRELSTHWRATCAYDAYGIDYQDYIRVNLSVVDFSSYYYIPRNSYMYTACQTIEFMHLLGVECHGCDFALYHLPSYTPMLKLTTSKSTSHCAFDMSQHAHFCQPGDESVFFIVRTCFDPRFRCQLTADSTTQNWFGSRA